MVRNASYLNWEVLAPLSYGLCTNHTPTSGRIVRNLVGTVGTISYRAYFAIDLDKRF
jgi:hypothetical protein